MRTTHDPRFNAESRYAESRHPESPYHDTPTKELIQDLMGQGKILLREEVRLAKEELRTDAKQVGKSAGMVGAGGVLLHTGMLVSAAFLVVLLDLLMPLWAAALIVAVVLLGVGAIVTNTGTRKLKETNLKPEQTIQTLEEDKAWMRRTMHAGTSKRHAIA